MMIPALIKYKAAAQLIFLLCVGVRAESDDFASDSGNRVGKSPSAYVPAQDSYLKNMLQGVENRMQKVMDANGPSFRSKRSTKNVHTRDNKAAQPNATRRLSNFDINPTLSTRLHEIYEPLRPGINENLESLLMMTFGKAAFDYDQAAEPQIVAKGLLLNHSRVEVTLGNIFLEKIPMVHTPQIDLNLIGMTVRIESVLSPIVLLSEYFVTKSTNESLHSDSPFGSYSSGVSGQISLVVEKCVLSGMLTLDVNQDAVGVETSNSILARCTILVEVSSYQHPDRPIIKNSIPDLDIDNELDLMIGSPIRATLYRCLNNIFFDVINITAIFGSELGTEFRTMAKVYDTASAQVIDDLVASINNYHWKQKIAGFALPSMMRTVVTDIGSLGATLYSTFGIEKISFDGLQRMFRASKAGVALLDEAMLLQATLDFARSEVFGEYIIEFTDKISKGWFNAILTDMRIGIILEITKHGGSYKARSVSVAMETFGNYEPYIQGAEFLNSTFRLASNFFAGYLLKVIPGTLNTYLADIFKTKAEKAQITFDIDVNKDVSDNHGNEPANLETYDEDTDDD